MRARLAGLSAIALLSVPPGGGLAQPPVGAVTTVSDLVVGAPEQAPVPNVGEGAPQFSVGQLDQIWREARKEAVTALSDANRCGQHSSVRPGNYRQAYDHAVELRGSALTAREATAAADQARRDAVRGKVSQQALEATELARQAAVRRMVAARTALAESQAVNADIQRFKLEEPNIDPLMLRQQVLGEINNRTYASGQRLRTVPSHFATLALEDASAVERTDGRGDFLYVSGLIRNTSRGPVGTPPLAITALDPAGFPLQTETADPGKGQRIAPGEGRAFGYELRPRPGNTRKVVVTFGSDEYEPWLLPVGRGGGRGPEDNIFCINDLDVLPKPNVSDAPWSAAAISPPSAARPSGSTEPPLAFENLAARPNEAGGHVISGSIRNPRNVPAEVPPFNIVLFDQDNRALATLRVASDSQPVAPRGTKPFSLTVAADAATRISRVVVVPNVPSQAAR